MFARLLFVALMALEDIACECSQNIQWVAQAVIEKRIGGGLIDAPRVGDEVAQGRSIVGIEAIELLNQSLRVAPRIQDQTVGIKIATGDVERQQLQVIFQATTRRLKQFSQHKRHGNQRWAGIEREAVHHCLIELAANLRLPLEHLHVMALRRQANGG